MVRILDKIKKFLDKHESEASVAGAATTEALKLSSPVVAVTVETVRSIFTQFNNIQCQMILNGLNKSENVEMRINQLYSYSKKKEGALILDKLGEQALHSQSTKALVILGIMLSECMEAEHDPDYEDMIIMRALQVATDYEILYMKEICENYIDEDGIVNEKRISEATLAKEYMRTLEWGKVNLVLGTTEHRYVHDIDFDIFGDYLVVNECTKKFMHYILEARQVLDYGADD